MHRNILHINIVNFYVSVACALEPRLRSYPLVVATSGASRPIVVDLSFTARSAGIRRGMLLERAQRCCPDLRILTPTPELYDRAAQVLFNEACRLSPRVEPAGPGHIFLDMTGTERLWGSGVDSGNMFRRTILEKYRFDPAVGVASNKLVSKIATRVIKPTGICRVVGGCEEEFLAPLPVHFLPGVEHTVIHHLMQFNIQLIHELYKIPQEQLQCVFGNTAREIHLRAAGIDPSPVRSKSQPAPSVQEHCVLDEHTNNDRSIEQQLFVLVSKAAATLRKTGLAARKICLRIRYSDGIRKQRQSRLSTPLFGDISLFNRFKTLLQQLFERRVRIAEVTIMLTDLSYPYGQMDLFEQPNHEENLMYAMDTIKNKYGFGAIRFFGLSTPPQPVQHG